MHEQNSEADFFISSRIFYVNILSVYVFVLFFLPTGLIPIRNQSECFEIDSVISNDIKLEVPIVFYRRSYDTIYVSYESN